MVIDIELGVLRVNYYLHGLRCQLDVDIQVCNVSPASGSGGEPGNVLSVLFWALFQAGIVPKEL